MTDLERIAYLKLIIEQKPNTRAASNAMQTIRDIREQYLWTAERANQLLAADTKNKQLNADCLAKWDAYHAIAA